MSASVPPHTAVGSAASDLPPIDIPSEPFRGIEPFRFSDQAIYSERRDQAVRLVKTVVIYRGSLLAGASGVGKSSLINAGFLPEIIREGYLPERVRVRPEPGGEFQFERIPVGEVDQPQFLPSRFDSERAPADHGSKSLCEKEFAKTVSAPHPAGPALLVFDQFEELITLFEEAPENRAKIEAAHTAQLAIVRTLSQLLIDAHLQVKFLFVFREDYFLKLSKFFQRIPGLREQCLYLEPLPVAKLKSLFRDPFVLARQRGQPFPREIDDSLAQDLAAAIEMRSGSNQINLTEVQIIGQTLWRDPQGAARFIAAQDKPGEVQALLERYTDGRIASLPEALQGPAEAILSRLVTSGGTRNIVSEQDLIEQMEKAESITPMVMRNALTELTSGSRLVNRQYRGETAFYDIASEFLIPWILRKRVERQRRRDIEQAKRKQVEAEVQLTRATRLRNLFCLALAGVTVVLILALGALWFAVQEKKKANDARDQADGLINFMLHDLRDKLAPIGRLEILDHVANKAKEYLDRLPKELVTASRLEQRAAMLNNLGNVLEAQGKLPEALDAYQQSLNIRRTLADQDKSNADWQSALSGGYGKVGDVLMAQGKLQEALDAYRKSLNIRRTLADQDKSNAGWLEDLAYGYTRIGNVLDAQGKLAQALDVYQQSLKIRQTLADQDKSNGAWQLDLSYGYTRIGNVLDAQGKLAQALDLYQQGLNIRRTLADQDKSNADWQSALSGGYEKVGDVLLAQGKLQEALNVYQQSLIIRRTLADQDKSNAGWQSDLSGGYEKVGDVLLAQGKLQEALNVYQQSLNIRRTLADRDKSNAGWQLDLSYGYEKVGDVLVAQGKLQEALNTYQNSLNIRRTLADQDKSNAVWQRDLSWSYERIGNVLEAQGELPEALDAYQKSLNIRRTLADQDKSNADWQSALSGGYAKVGNVLAEQGKLAQALDVYQQSLNIRRTLADQEKSNASWQHDLSSSYEKVGGVLVAQGKLAQALDVYRQSLNIRRTLADQDKSNAGWQRDLIMSLYKVGTTTAKIGGNDNVTQAQGFLQTGLNLAELYSGPDRQSLINDLNLALRNLVH